MEYFMSPFEHLFHEKKDVGEALFSCDHMTIQAYHLRQNTSLLEHMDGPDDAKSGHTICYLVLKGKLELRYAEEKVDIEAGKMITVHMDRNFTIWAVEESDFFAFHNQVEPNVDNSPKELVKAVKKVELADTYLSGHNYRVGKYTTLIMQAIAPERSTIQLHYAAAYHDVGKSVVDPEILNKPGKLSKEEFDEIKKHPAASFDMLKQYIGETAAYYARWHHEKLDGSGYPDGIQGDQIPLESRIMAVSDVFDALTTSRCYRGAFSFDKALGILDEDVSHGKLDGEVVAVLRRMIETGAIQEGVDNMIGSIENE